MPTAAASSTAGWRSSTSSISRGAMFSPPLMMSSLMRPVTKKKPSPSRTAEVARAQPAAGEERRRGRLRILVVAGHDLRAADHDLARRAVGQRPRPRSSTTRASQPEARPTEPTLRRAGSRGLENAGATVSVSPMVSMMPMPNFVLEGEVVLGRQRARRPSDRSGCAPAARAAACRPPAGRLTIVGHHVDPGAAGAGRHRPELRRPRSAAASRALPPCASGASIVTAKALM